MSQYTLYTVSVTKDSNTVTGTTGTTFLTKVSSGNAFKVKGSPVIYEVASVDSNTQLSLTSPYKGDTAYNVAYQITTDYTPNFGLVEVNVGDQDWPVHLTHGTIRKIDELLGSFVGGFIFKGGWDVAANNPTIPVATIGNAGWIYKVVKTGTTNVGGIVEWFLGDSLISNGTEWVRVPSADFDKFAAESASDAAASANSATASANSATASANSATASAASATVSQSVATAAESGAVAAAASLTSALAAFNTTFLGRHAEDPLLDGEGNPILDGATYVNTGTDTIRIYSIETGTWANYDEAAQAATTSANLSAANASASAVYALASKDAAALSETNSAASAAGALASKDAAALSETNSAASAAGALASKDAAALSETNSAASAQSALTSLLSLKGVTNAVVNQDGHLILTYSDLTEVDTGHVIGPVGLTGAGIVSILRTSGDGSAGTTDTYTITFTNANTTTFPVYNGADGIGSGDMLKAVYDPDLDGIIAFAQLSGVAASAHTHSGVYEPANSNIQEHVISVGNPHGVTKTQVGLSNVDNTADVDKPVSTSMNTALSTKADLVEGKVPAAQLPAYVDDVLEYSSLAAFPVTGTAGIVYVAIDTNVTYRWSGSAYVVIGSDLALGETSSTAYRGDLGKVAYNHSQVTHAPSDAEANVNADWDAVSGDAQILNKPTLGEMAAQADVATDGKQYVRKDKVWSEVVIPEGGVVAEAKSAGFTAVKNRRYVCDTSSAAFTCTLPANPAVGDYIEFLDSHGTWNPNNLTLGRNDSLISGTAEDFICDTDNVQISLTFVSVTYGWAVKVGASALTAAPHTTTSHSDWPAAVSMTEVGYLEGVTSALQTQLNNKQASGSYATLTGAETLTNKTIESVILTNGYTEEVFDITDGAAVDLDPANGSIQTWTLGASRAATESLATGQSIILGIDDGTAYSLTWPTITWTKVGGGGAAPALATAGKTWVVLWKVGTTLYGSHLGDA